MKFDVFGWNEVKANEEVHFAKGRLCLRFSAPAALFVTCEGVEALVGYGASFDLEVSDSGTFRAEGLKSLRVFRQGECRTAVPAVGEVFTNIDRLPDESGAVMEVRRALRELELARRASIAEIRAEQRKARVASAPQSVATADDGGADGGAASVEGEE